jgi:hypothetical protein
MAKGWVELTEEVIARCDKHIAKHPGAAMLRSGYHTLRFRLRQSTGLAEQIERMEQIETLLQSRIAALEETVRQQNATIKLLEHNGPIH